MTDEEVIASKLVNDGGDEVKAAAEARKSADAATGYAANAKKSADSAAASAARASQSAATARNAAAAANRDADAAEASAQQAELSADYARQSARKADYAATRARASAIAAGKSKDEAEAAAGQAWTEVKFKREAEIAEEKRRQAEELRKQQAKQNQKQKPRCTYREAAVNYYPATCDGPPSDIEFSDVVSVVRKGAWEFSGAADIEKCIKEPTWGGCTMAVAGVLPVGKVKLLKKAADGVEDIAKGTRQAREVPPCIKPGKHSFPAGTRVLMGDRTTRPIEQLVVGDQVLATDPETGVTGPRRVEATIYTPDDRDFTDITLDQTNGGGSLTTTDHHPFWTENDKKWKNAANLTPQDTLRTPDGDTAQIHSIRHWTSLQPAYNLTIDDLHTYYVLAGETPALVHNSSSGPDPSSFSNLIPADTPHWFKPIAPGTVLSRSGNYAYVVTGEGGSALPVLFLRG